MDNTITNLDGIVRVNGQTWAEFSRCYSNPHRTSAGQPAPFWACLLRGEGGWTWYDSASNYETAVHWLCYFCGEMDLSPEAELIFAIDRIENAGHQIVSSTMLRDLWEKGLVL